MRLLVDTCAVIWLRTSRSRFSRRVLDLLEDSSNQVYVSAASSWELAIKRSLGRLDPGFKPNEMIPRALAESGLEPLGITHEHALNVGNLPPYHKDPFDRLLVSQCQIEGLTMLSPDGAFKAYGISVLW